MAFFWLLVVLAITYNQGAARPADSDLDNETSNGWDSSEQGIQNNSDDGKVFEFPTSIRKGLLVTINGTINMNDQTFTVVLPSRSSKDDCVMKFDFAHKMIYISPPIEGNGSQYDANFSYDSREAPKFTLHLKARLFSMDEQEAFSMTFNVNNAGDSPLLTCQVKDFPDIDRIMIKEGVAHVDTLLFDFEENH